MAGRNQHVSSAFDGVRQNLAEGEGSYVGEGCLAASRPRLLKEEVCYQGTPDEEKRTGGENIIQNEEVLFNCDYLS